MLLDRDERGSGPPVALLHGFAQTRRCWGPLADVLAGTHRTILLDAPGHGGSPLAGADLPCGAAAVAATLRDAAATPAHVLGYSMGGRLALQVALDHPSAVRSLVLLGATPGIEDPAERAARRDRDAALAARIERIGVARFCQEWLAQDLFSDLPVWARFEPERRENRADALAASLRAAGTGSMEPLWARLGELSVPVLCVTGARDERFTATAARMVAAIGPNARAVVVPGAGHAAHLVAPDQVATAVSAFLDELDGPLRLTGTAPAP
jgi:2-succinyl-6-hydroxy-2,4-cyclohexadiene-1-carboxylate synthase